MNIADMIGPVDVYSAGVAIAFAVGATITTTTLIARYQSKRETDQKFELEKIKLINDDAEKARQSDVNREIGLGKIAANRQVEIARIEGGMLDVQAARSPHPGDG